MRATILVSALAVALAPALPAAAALQSMTKQYVPERTPGNPNPAPIFPPYVELDQTGLSAIQLRHRGGPSIGQGRYSSLRTAENGEVRGYDVRVLPTAVELTICAAECSPVLRSAYTRGQGAIRFTVDGEGLSNAQVTMTPNGGSVDIRINHQGRQWSDTLAPTPD